MSALVTTAQARQQLRLADDLLEYDAELDAIVERATALVVDYLERAEDDWAAGSPMASPADYEFPIVQAAILEVVTNLWRHRGDEGAQPGPMTPRVEHMLRGLKTPALG